MRGAVPVASELPRRLHPPAVPIRELWPWALFASVLALVLLFLIGVEGSAVSFARGELVHEFVHDGRHLLAFPCH